MRVSAGRACGASARRHGGGGGGGGRFGAEPVGTSAGRGKEEKPETHKERLWTPRGRRPCHPGQVLPDLVAPRGRLVVQAEKTSLPREVQAGGCRETPHATSPPGRDCWAGSCLCFVAVVSSEPGVSFVDTCQTGDTRVCRGRQDTHVSITPAKKAACTIAPSRSWLWYPWVQSGDLKPDRLSDMLQATQGVCDRART